MNIFLTCPTFEPHGGIRVILEWANRLAHRGHAVVLRSDDRRGCSWAVLDPGVMIAYDDAPLQGSDCLIVASPHGVGYLEHPDAPTRRVVFMQMAEHLFRPTDRAWQRQCRAFYRAPCPLILISRWNESEVRRAGRAAPVHYVGNGVNLEDFPLEESPKDGRTVLVEGWVPDNPTKDSERIAAEVATCLARDGYRILGYGRRSPPAEDHSRGALTDFVVRPTLAQLNALYREATILLKASRCDARACAPMEAMTKGTVTARAIIQGDDDLVHEQNALRCGYNAGALYAAARRLLTEPPLRERLARACLAYVQTHTWDRWIPQIEGILCRA